jgi:hypothetical protein
LWIARTQEPSPPDAGNTIYRSRYFPFTNPRKRRSRDSVPAKLYKSGLKELLGCSSGGTRALGSFANLRSDAT